METNERNLGVLLKTLRIERKLSLREFSKYLDISHTYLNKLEKGTDSKRERNITPTVEALMKMSKGLNMPFKQFLELAGYFDDGSILKFEEPMGCSSVDIAKEIDLLLFKLSAATEVYAVNKTVTAEHIKEVEESLKECLQFLWENHYSEEE